MEARQRPRIFVCMAPERRPGWLAPGRDERQPSTEAAGAVAGLHQGRATDACVGSIVASGGSPCIMRPLCLRPTWQPNFDPLAQGSPVWCAGDTATLAAS